METSEENLLMTLLEEHRWDLFIKFSGIVKYSSFEEQEKWTRKLYDKLDGIRSFFSRYR